MLDNVNGDPAISVPIPKQVLNNCQSYDASGVNNCFGAAATICIVGAEDGEGVFSCQ